MSLTVEGEEPLMAWAFRLQLAKIPHTLIFEPDAPYDGQLMAIGIAPGRKEDLRKHLSTLPLLR